MKSIPTTTNTSWLLAMTLLAATMTITTDAFLLPSSPSPSISTTTTRSQLKATGGSNSNGPNDNNNNDPSTSTTKGSISSLPTLLRLLSTVYVGGAYFTSPVFADSMYTSTSTTSTATTMATSTLTAGNIMESTCLGFGCGSYQGLGDNGAPAVTNGEANIDMQAFLKAIDDKKVERVELLDGGNLAYAYVKTGGGEGGEGAAAAAEGSTSRVRIGEGYPVDSGKSWSSPLFVVRILKDKAIPYTIKYDFSQVKTQQVDPPQWFK